MPSASFWQRLVLKHIRVLLEESDSYTLPEVESFLDFVDRTLIQLDALGPDPTSSSSGWKSYLTDDHSPVEYSLSIKKDFCTTRFAFEPLSTDTDSINHDAPIQWLSKQSIDADGKLWFDTLVKLLTITPSLSSNGLKSDEHIKHVARGLTQHIFAFDLAKKPLLKSYIFHDALARQVAVSASDWGEEKDRLLFQAMDALGLSTPWKKVASYLSHLRNSHPKYAGQTEFIGWDMVSPDTSRMKVYVRFANAGLPQLLSHLDLGGALDPDKAQIQEIKAAATEMWQAFLGEDQLSTSDINNCDTRTQGVILYYELKKNHPDPSAKFYLPVRHYLSSDLLIAERFDAFLAHKQLRESGWYLAMLQKYCDHRKLDSRPGLQTMVGCANRNGEWEVSMYLSAEVFAPERWI
ncbi:aromatic prenyltransferase [Rhodocollybia butyracea]|uniref:Aromatic prenyltransferase n=1 Tax=Rhodocollybia butyracea TaxID=206335 RepID=A0A9P5Q909_9AGAR|nr:aromatic prenyltransferase [Rhodocollybia butyracea]